MEEKKPKVKKNKNAVLTKKAIEFLKTGPKTRKELWDHLGGPEAVPKSTLSNLTTDLKKRDIINDFKPGEKIVLNAAQSEYGALDKTILNEWVILYAVSRLEGEKGNIKEILDKYLEISAGERSDSAEQMIRYYIESRLVPAGLLEKSRSSDGSGARHEYSVSGTAPIIAEASFEQLDQYLRLYCLENTHIASQTIADRVKLLLYGRDFDSDEISFVSGKLNRFQQESLRNVDKLLKLPYKEKKVLITTKSNSKITDQMISVGLLFYSSEINEFYILGEFNKAEILIRMSSVIEMKETNQENVIFASERFNKYLDEMMGVENGKLYDVRIRFKNTEYVRNRLKSLTAGRKSAHIENINFGNELLYTDKVRGLGLLARTLRSMGACSIVEEPGQLRNMMLDTAGKIEMRYSERQEQLDAE